MTKTVLIVTSSYAPAMIADMQRARLLAWELPAFGWNVEILAPASSYQDPSVLDPDSEAFFHAGTPVYYASPLRPVLRYLIRSRTIGWRALWPLHMTAQILFSRRRIDLVYISTTQFNLFFLGWWWRIRYGLPYVLDIHDPVRKTTPGFYGGTRPGLKRTFNQWLHGHIESCTTRLASGVVAVSPKYIETMKSRYSKRGPEWLHSDSHAVIPFAASERDLLQAKTRLRDIERPAGASRRIIYVGAGGPVMAKGFAVLCHAIRALIDRREMPDCPIMFELYGTMFGWREGERKHLLEMAEAAGITSVISEYPQRVSYRRSLELLLEADGVLVLGVDDEGYMPSKLYAYALSGKPLLGVFRRLSPACDQLLAEPRMGHLLPFGDGDSADGEKIVPVKRFLDEVAVRASFDRRPLITNHLDVAMAEQHARLFDACIARQSVTTAAN